MGRRDDTKSNRKWGSCVGRGGRRLVDLQFRGGAALRLQAALGLLDCRNVNTG
jgi:hypothetical protein